MKTAWLEMLGGEVRYYSANGVRTRCLEAGSGEPMLLLHGRGAHAETWMRNVMPLAESFHVYAIDLLGHGCTDTPRATYDVGDFARHAEAFLDAVGITTAHMGGHTLGGWIAVWLAHTRPERVKTLATVLCAGLAEERAARPTPQPERSGSLFQSTLEDESEETMRKRMLRLFHDPSNCTDELVATRAALYRRSGVRDALRQMAAADNGACLLTPDVLAGIRQPTLFIGSEHAHSTDASAYEKAVAIMGSARFESVPNAAQWPQYEEPERVNRLIRDWARGG